MSDELKERVAALLNANCFEGCEPGADEMRACLHPPCRCRTLAVAAIALVLEEAARKVPTTWLDPLLTGPGATELPLDGPGVEKLCRGITAAIRALRGKP